MVLCDLIGVRDGGGIGIERLLIPAVVLGVDRAHRDMLRLMGNNGQGKTSDARQIFAVLLPDSIMMVLERHSR